MREDIIRLNERVELRRVQECPVGKDNETFTWSGKNTTGY